MAFMKLLPILVFGTVLLLDRTIKADACRCLQSSLCDAFKVDFVVLTATALSRSESVETYGDVTYTLEITTIYKGESDVSSEQEISITTSESNSCGVYLDLDKEYLLGLSQSSDGGFTVNLCNLVENWSSVSDEDKASLEAGCEEDPCDGACGEFQECLFHSDSNIDEYYCADVCDPSPCEDGEKCTLEQLVQCVRAPCPRNAVCN